MFVINPIYGKLMMNTGTEIAIKERYLENNEIVLFLSDFSDLGPEKEIETAIENLVKEGFFLAIGKEIYALAAYSQRFKCTVPVKSLRELAIIVLSKLGIQAYPSTFERDYNEGRSTQVPNGFVIGVHKPVPVEIYRNGRNIYFEDVSDPTKRCVPVRKGEWNSYQSLYSGAEDW